MRVALNGVGLFLLLLSASSYAYTVRSDHPRLLINSDDLAWAKCRAGLENNGACPEFGSHAHYFERLEAWVNYYYPQMTVSSDAPTIYTGYAMLTDNAEICEHMATWSQGAWGEDNDYSHPYPAYAFDWCYDLLSSSTRESLGNYLADHLRGEPCDLGGYRWLPRQGQNSRQVSIALYNEGFDDVKAAEDLDCARERYYDYHMPSWEELAADGAWDGYIWSRFKYVLSTAQMFESALGDSAGYSFGAIQNHALFLAYKMRFDYRLSKNPSEHNTAGYRGHVLIAHLAQITQNPYIQSLASEMVADFESHATVRSGEYLWLLFFYNEQLPSAPLDDLPLSSAFLNNGQIFFRSNWNYQDPEVIQGAFFLVPDIVLGHKHANSFIINRGDDSLALDTGTRNSEEQAHYDVWFSNNLAHNGMTITMPGEDFGTYRPYYYWGDNTPYPMPNAGFETVSDTEEAQRRWPNSFSGSIGPGYRGEINSYFYDNAVMYAQGNATHAYLPEKVDWAEGGAYRHFFFIQPDQFLIIDRVDTVSPSYEKKWLLHTAFEPQFTQGSFNTQEGIPGVGGIFTSTNAFSFFAEQQNSKLFGELLYPHSNVLARKIGGQNADADPWKQTHDPGYPCYAPNNPSYEFWVEDANDNYAGSNFMPIKINNYNPGGNPPPSCDGASAAFRQQESGGYFPAGDWRIEFVVDNQAFANYVVFLEASDAAQSTPSVTPELVESPQAVGAKLGTRVLITPKIGRTNTLSYSVAGTGSLQHYAADLEPGVYAVTQNGYAIETNAVVTEDEHLLSFSSTGGGTFVISGDALPTCAEQDGYECSLDETCPGGQWIPAGDTDRCCAVACEGIGSDIPCEDLGGHCRDDCTLYEVCSLEPEGYCAVGECCIGACTESGSPAVTLETPLNGASLPTGNTRFVCSAFDDSGLREIALYMGSDRVMPPNWGPGYPLPEFEVYGVDMQKVPSTGIVDEVPCNMAGYSSCARHSSYCDYDSGEICYLSINPFSYATNTYDLDVYYADEYDDGDGDTYLLLINHVEVARFTTDGNNPNDEAAMQTFSDISIAAGDVFDLYCIEGASGSHCRVHKIVFREISGNGFEEVAAQSVSGTNAQAQFHIDLSEGDYDWNCLAEDVYGNTAFAVNPFSLTIRRGTGGGSPLMAPKNKLPYQAITGRVPLSGAESLELEKQRAEQAAFRWWTTTVLLAGSITVAAAIFLFERNRRKK
ncbi:hypothetical protein KJ765_00455 [Candidatus Micrarchaeota archaeon]|nr:hypothetical protein [Candidatus Micrarchaeota archaeon]